MVKERQNPSVRDCPSGDGRRGRERERERKEEHLGCFFIHLGLFSFELA